MLSRFEPPQLRSSRAVKTDEEGIGPPSARREVRYPDRIVKRSRAVACEPVEGGRRDLISRRRIVLGIDGFHQPRFPKRQEHLSDEALGLDKREYKPLHTENSSDVLTDASARREVDVSLEIAVPTGAGIHNRRVLWRLVLIDGPWRDQALLTSLLDLLPRRPVQHVNLDRQLASHEIE
jgi:hypothetical protein